MRLLLCALFLPLWLALFAPAIRWLEERLAEGDYRLNLFILLGFLGICLHGVVRDRRAVTATLLRGPLRAPLPLIFCALSALAFVPAQHLLGLQTLSAALFCLGSYGLLGLYLPPGRFRQGLPLLLLVVLLLPFQDHLDTYLGFPARVATARVVHRYLALLGVPVASAESILLLDGGVAHVALPCSGMRSLWSGALFLLGATWLFRRRLDLKWLLCGGLLLGGLLLANTARVMAIVLLAVVAHRPDLADIVHVPLGVLGFAACCLATLQLLRRGPRHRDAPCVPPPPPLATRQLMLGAILLALLLAVSHLWGQPPAPPVQLQGELSLPAGWSAQPLPLTEAETDLFAGHGGVLARKWRFTAGGATGSLLVVVSRSFRAHHDPQVCLLASGLRVQDVRTVAVAPEFPARQLLLRDQQDRPLSALYWFQSAQRTTAEILLRSLADLRPGREPWALVSIVFDSESGPDLPQVRDQLSLLHRAVAVRLQGALP